MKTVVEIKSIDKLTVLDSCLLSCEAKQYGQDVLLWYYAKCYWKKDLARLKKALGKKISFSFFSWYDKRFFNIPLKRQSYEQRPAKEGHGPSRRLQQLER